jgi:hypothetical protein
LGKSQVAVFIATVEFIANDGVAMVGEMDADLVFAPGAGKDT